MNFPGYGNYGDGTIGAYGIHPSVMDVDAALLPGGRLDYATGPAQWVTPGGGQIARPPGVGDFVQSMRCSVPGGSAGAVVVAPAAGGMAGLGAAVPQGATGGRARALLVPILAGVAGILVGSKVDGKRGAVVGGIAGAYAPYVVAKVRGRV